tara:strand:- start:735 stop:1658 length:924 start_codon:yes stop_codon:yes gene_type:complete
MDNMITDPLFILGISGMTICLVSWIRFNLKEGKVEPLVVKYISTISLISGIALLLSIFLNSGDLGVVLLAGSIIALIVMITGYYFKNIEIITTARGYFIPLLAIFILRTFLYEPYQIPSGSMEPQLKKGDFLLVNKYAYGLKVNRIGIPNILKTDPQYGDVVVLIPPHNPIPYIKRLIGKPGDTIRIINKQIYVNGVALEKMLIKSEEIVIQERYTRKANLYTEKNFSKEYIIRNIRGINVKNPQEWTVPKGHYFVMGDNRDNSNDSTKWDFAFVPRENFFGRADILWMTWECWTCLPSFKKAGKIN